MNQWNEQFMSSNAMPLQPPLMPPMMAGIMDDINGRTLMEGTINHQLMAGAQVMPGQHVMSEDMTGMSQEIQEVNMDMGDDNSVDKFNSRGSRSGPRIQDRRRRSRSRERHERDRSRHEPERSRHEPERSRDRRDRPRQSKWSDGNSVGQNVPLGQSGRGGIQNMMMQTPANMMQYPAAMYNNPIMGQPQMDLQAMTHVQTNMLGGMGMTNIMPNMMMDQNMLQMYNNQMMGANQAVYLTNAVLLPPMPGISLPQRREKPTGCCTIFVGGLPDVITEDLLTELFQRFGKIVDLKLNRKGFCHVRFALPESVEAAFSLNGYRFKYQDQMDSEAITMFIDYALSRDDQADYERTRKTRDPTPPRIEPYSPANMAAVAEKIKSEELFAEAAPTLSGWLERGECNKKNANTFYSLIQASNNQIRRLFNEKMQVEDEYATLKANMKEKFQHIIAQFELVRKIFTASKHQRVWDHFSKQQRRNIDMWMKMTLDLDNLKEEFNGYFDEDDEKPNKKAVWEEKYEELKRENESLTYELEGYKNEAHVAKEEAERRFEKFKAHFIAQQALQNKQSVGTYPPLPLQKSEKPPPPPPVTEDDAAEVTGPSVPPTEARLISVITAFLLVHPLGASLDYILSYVRSIMPKVTQTTVHDVLQKYPDVFSHRSSGVGASIENRWTFVTFDNIKAES